MKKKQFRNLSGIFFREQIDGHWENVCFEELGKESQDRILSEKNPEFVKNLAKMLSETLVEIGNQFNLQKD